MTLPDTKGHTYVDAWPKIKALQNYIVEVKSSKDGVLKLKVVVSVMHDNFKEVEKEEEKHLQSKNTI